MSSSRELPDYDHPPAIETALGVRFAPIEGWNLFHFGLLKAEFEKEYPKQELHPPLDAVTIQLAPNQRAGISHIPVRAWFINGDDTQLIQVQNNCFIRNWRKTDGTPDYQHYDVIKPLFQRDWSKFRDFLIEQELPAPNVWQCEVSYINHFVRGKDWNDFSDLKSLYPAWQDLPTQGLFSKPQMVAFTASYSLPNEQGILQFVSQPGIRQTDGIEIIQLSITALGKPKGSGEEDVLGWLDMGREAVVCGFSQFTDENAQKRWGRK